MKVRTWRRGCRRVGIQT